MNLARREGDNLDDLPGIEEFINEVPTDIDGISEVNEDIPTDAESEVPQPEPVSKMSN